MIDTRLTRNEVIELNETMVFLGSWGISKNQDMQVINDNGIKNFILKNGNNIGKNSKITFEVKVIEKSTFIEFMFFSNENDFNTECVYLNLYFNDFLEIENIDFNRYANKNIVFDQILLEEILKFSSDLKKEFLKGEQ